jgi:hypothetical protein
VGSSDGCHSLRLDLGFDVGILGLAPIFRWSNGREKAGIQISPIQSYNPGLCS